MINEALTKELKAGECLLGYTHGEHAADFF